jgi:hypothetical protein
MTDDAMKAIATLAEAQTRLMIDSEVIFGVVSALIQSHPNKPLLAEAIRASAEHLLEQWAGQSDASLAHLTARINQALEECGESPGKATR